MATHWDEGWAYNPFRSGMMTDCMPAGSGSHTQMCVLPKDHIWIIYQISQGLWKLRQKFFSPYILNPAVEKLYIVSFLHWGFIAKLVRLDFCILINRSWAIPTFQKVLHIDAVSYWLHNLNSNETLSFSEHRLTQTGQQNIRKNIT